MKNPNFTAINMGTKEEKILFAIYCQLTSLVYLCLINKKLDKLSIDNIEEDKTIKDFTKEIYEIFKYYEN